MALTPTEQNKEPEVLHVPRVVTQAEMLNIIFDELQQIKYLLMEQKGEVIGNTKKAN